MTTNNTNTTFEYYNLERKFESALSCRQMLHFRGKNRLCFFLNVFEVESALSKLVKNLLKSLDKLKQIINSLEFRLVSIKKSIWVYNNSVTNRFGSSRFYLYRVWFLCVILDEYDSTRSLLGLSNLG